MLITHNSLKFRWKERVFDFLACLDAEFDQVVIQILGKEQMPSLNEVFSIVRTEEIEDY